MKVRQMKFRGVMIHTFAGDEFDYYKNYINSLCPPHISVEVVDIKGPPLPPDFKTPTFIKGGGDLRGVAIAAPLMIERAEEAEREGCDAVIFCCGWDPGLFGAKAAVSIPVIGYAETMYHVASLLADRWGLITGYPQLKSLIRKGIQAYGVADHIVSIKTLEAFEFAPHQAFQAKPAEYEAKFIKLSKELISEGAELITISCSPLIPSLGREVLKRFREQLGVPVIEPIETALRMAETLVNLGLVQSKITYPRVQREKI